MVSTALFGMARLALQMYAPLHALTRTLLLGMGAANALGGAMALLTSPQRPGQRVIHPAGFSASERGDFDARTVYERRSDHQRRDRETATMPKV
jgi:hypothetical protein